MSRSSSLIDKIELLKKNIEDIKINQNEIKNLIDILDLIKDETNNLIKLHRDMKSSFYDEKIIINNNFVKLMDYIFMIDKEFVPDFDQSSLYFGITGKMWMPPLIE